MKKVCVLGHFGFGKTLLNGQTVKTKILSETLEKYFNDEIVKIDTHGGIITLFKAPFHALKAFKQAKNIVILPAHNGLRVYAPLLVFVKSFFKKRKLHYVVIGGWLPGFLEKRKFLTKCLKKFDGIYVETNTMRNSLDKFEFENVYIMPNCKELNILDPEKMIYQNNSPYKLATFSRVMKEKGIEYAVEAVKYINNKYKKNIFELDIYGQIDEGQTEWFEKLESTFPEYIRYGGLVPFDKSVDVLKNYFLLLFPTRFYTEGVPGTIIDGYAAGVPIVSARWESFSDVVDEEITGYGYAFDNFDEFVELLQKIVDAPQMINTLKANCLNKAKCFLPYSVVGELVANFE